MARDTKTTKVDLTTRTRTHHDIELRLPAMPQVEADDTVSLVLTSPADDNGNGKGQVIRLNYAMVQALRHGRDW